MKLFRWLCLAILLASTSVCADDPPNIVLIISDDQSAADFGFMGHPYIRTPHLDRLAAQSARYINGYVPSSVCRPSLATLLTGLYPHQHGIHFNHPPPGFGRMRRLSEEQWYAARARAEVLIESVPTLPRTLAKHGYRSFQSGKHWEGDYQTAGFTDGMTRNRPSDPPAYGNLTLADGSVVAHGNGDAGLNIGRETMRPIDDFLDDHIEQHSEQPFLIWYAPFLPHVPHDAPERFREPYLKNPAVPRHMVNYAAACTWFDETVGQLVNGIDQRGLAKETIFIFVIDNGYRPAPESHPDEKSITDIHTKRSPFEAGLRTPILIRWDGHVVPATHEELVSSVDIMPTLLAAAKLQGTMGKLPGLNLLPSALGNESLDPQRPVFGGIYPGDATSLGHPERDIAYRWVRQGRFKLIIPQRQRGEIWRNYLTEPALFDVVADPGENHNLADEPDFAKTLRRLNRRLDQWWRPAPKRHDPNPATIPKNFPNTQNPHKNQQKRPFRPPPEP